MNTEHLRRFVLFLFITVLSFAMARSAYAEYYYYSDCPSCIARIECNTCCDGCGYREVNCCPPPVIVKKCMRKYYYPCHKMKKHRLHYKSRRAHRACTEQYEWIQGNGVSTCNCW